MSHGKRLGVDLNLYAASNYGDKISLYVDRTDAQNCSLDPVTENDAKEALIKYALAYLGGLAFTGFCFYAAYLDARKQCARLANWPLAMLSVTKVGTKDSRTSELKVAGTIQDDKGRKIEIEDVAIGGDVHVDRPIPVLVDPHGDTVVALERLKSAEIDRS